MNGIDATPEFREKIDKFIDDMNKLINKTFGDERIVYYLNLAYAPPELNGKAFTFAVINKPKTEEEMDNHMFILSQALANDPMASRLVASMIFDKFLDNNLNKIIFDADTLKDNVISLPHDKAGVN